MNKELSDRIWNRDEFKKEYEMLLSEGFKTSFSLFETSSKFSMISLKRLLESATIFATTEEKIYKEAAYRIAVNALILFNDDLDNLHELIEFILMRLGNFPAINLITKRDKGEEESGKTLPLSSIVESIYKVKANTIKINHNDIKLTDFQKELWNYLRLGTTVSLSAPTSAGKSFILQNYIMDKMLTNAQFKAIYIVPSRALITQVSNTLTKAVKENKITDLIISKVSNSSLNTGYEKVIYVLTQERLQILLEENEQQEFNLIIVDESQLISEKDRGVILQYVLEKLLSINHNIQIVFASPLTENPQLLPEIFGIQEYRSIKEDESPVAQNLIFLDLVQDLIKIETLINDRKVPIGEKKLLYNDKEESLLSKIAVQFGVGKYNLVYAGGQAKSEEIAKDISNLIEEDTNDQVLLQFIDFIKEYIHEEYELVNTLKKGVAFHYGNIPAIIRMTIEDLYSRGKLKYLITTSTLLHGVNLPAQNLFLDNPTKGFVNTNEGRKDIPLEPLEFWNLAGRAGRMGIDFQGNIFLVNLNEWIENPIEGKVNKTVEVTSAFNKHLIEDSKRLIAFIKDKGHSSGILENQGLENTFVKLYNHLINNNLDKVLDDLNDNISTDVKAELYEALNEVNKQLSIPGPIVQKNISVSPYRQDQMLKYLIKKINKEGPTKFIPMHPLREWDDVYKNYLWTFKRIHTNLQKIPGQDKSHYFFTPLAIRWMRGESYYNLIHNAYEYRAENMKRGVPNISAVIRQVMSNIEKELRFRYVKYFSSYLDILRFALDETNNSSLKDNIPNIPLYLELGASSKTMISIMELGLSRATASILAPMLKNNNFGPEEVKEWILRTDLSGLSIPLICKEEVENLFVYEKLV